MRHFNEISWCRDKPKFSILKKISWLLLKSFPMTHFPTPPSCLGQHMFVAWASTIWRYEDKWIEISCEINLDLLFLLQIRLFDLRLCNLLKLKSSLRTLICCFRSKKKVLWQEKKRRMRFRKENFGFSYPDPHRFTQSRWTQSRFICNT